MKPPVGEQSAKLFYSRIKRANEGDVVRTIGRASVTVLGEDAILLHEKYAGQLFHHLEGLAAEAVRERAHRTARPRFRVHQRRDRDLAQAERLVMRALM